MRMSSMLSTLVLVALAPAAPMLAQQDEGDWEYYDEEYSWEDPNGQGQDDGQWQWESWEEEPQQQPMQQQRQQAQQQQPQQQIQSSSSLDAARNSCVARINAYRATKGLKPLQRWRDGEACADQGSRSDAMSGQAHGSMGQCGEFAQNSCPNYPNIDSVNGSCLQSMWNEGEPPSRPCSGQCFMAHGHYLNMSNPSYTKVACGYFMNSNGTVYSNQNFK